MRMHFLDKMLPLAMWTFGVLFRNAWNIDDATRVMIPGELGGQDTQKPLGVEPIRPRLPGAYGHQDACRLNHMVDHVMRHKQSVWPKSVASRFKNSLRR